MGRSVFSFGKLVRCVVAGELGMVEVDLCVAFVQLRVHHAPPDERLPACRELLAQENTDDFFKARCGDVSLKDAKRDFKAVQNCCAKVDLGRYTPEFRRFLEQVHAEMAGLIYRAVREVPGLVDLFVHRRNPTLSAHSVIDEHHESTTMDAVLDALERAVTGDQLHAAAFVRREHDGCALTLNGLSREEVLAVARAAAPGYKFAVKEYCSWQEHAREKYPLESWDEVSTVPTRSYIDALKAARDCSDNPVQYNRRSLVFRELVEATMYSRVISVRGEVNFFDGGIWKQSQDLPYMVHQSFKSIFARTLQNHDDDADLSYILDSNMPPASDGNFVKLVARHLEEFAKPERLDDLDADSEMLLLFADGMVYDFKQNVARMAKPQERLSRHCPKGFPQCVAPTELVKAAELTVDALRAFYKAGGVSLTLAGDEADTVLTDNEVELDARASVCVRLLEHLVEEHGRVQSHENRRVPMQLSLRVTRSHSESLPPKVTLGAQGGPQSHSKSL